MKRLLVCMLLTVSLLFSAAFAENQAPAAGTEANAVSGIYSGTAQGYMGYVTVYVTLKDGAIEKVDVGACTDMPDNISRVVCSTLPDAIVQAQSVNVDTVAGATFTSNAIKSAVTAALTEAGVADQFKEKVQTVSAPVEDATVDVLVIGGGATGEQAALNAKYPGYGEDNGLSVMLVEKQAFLGGASMLAGGTYTYVAPLQDNSNMQNEEMFQGLLDFLSTYAGGEKGNRDALYAMYEVAGDTLLKMQAHGYSLITDGKTNAADTYSALCPGGIIGLNSGTIDSNGYNQHGTVLQHFFAEQLKNSAIDVRLNTKAVELLVEDGAVVGAVMEHQGASYQVRAKKVILATGGMIQSRELLSTYYPDWIGVIPFGNAGSTGDAVTLTQGLDTVVDGDHNMMQYLTTDWRFGPYSPLALIARGYQSAVLVNKEGERFVADGAGYADAVLRQMLTQNGRTAYAILDATHASAAEAESLTDKDYVFKADTLEELADLVGLPKDTLTETIRVYNEAAASGQDDSVFGVKNEAMAPVLTAPYYAVKLIPTTVANYDGLRVNAQFEVLRADGTVIPNLYCGGEAAHTGSYSTLAAAIFSGRLIGEEAAAAVLGN